MSAIQRKPRSQPSTLAVLPLDDGRQRASTPSERRLLLLVPMLRAALQAVLDEHAQTGGGCDGQCCLCGTGGAVVGGLWAADVLHGQLSTFLRDGPRHQQRRLERQVEAEIAAALPDEAQHEVCSCQANRPRRQRYGSTEGVALNAAEQLSEALEQLATETQWVAHPDGTSSGDDDVRMDCIHLAWLSRLIGREVKAIADVPGADTARELRGYVPALAGAELAEAQAEVEAAAEKFERELMATVGQEGPCLSWEELSDAQEQALSSLEVASDNLAIVAQEYTGSDERDADEITSLAGSLGFLTGWLGRELGKVLPSPGRRERARLDQERREDYREGLQAAATEQGADTPCLCSSGG